MNELQVSKLLELIERIADALESIDTSLDSIEQKGLNTYEQNEP
jgi:hypothetical protein